MRGAKLVEANSEQTEWSPEKSESRYSWMSNAGRDWSAKIDGSCSRWHTGIVNGISDLVHDGAGSGRISTIILSPGVPTCVAIAGGDDPVTGVSI